VRVAGRTKVVVGIGFVVLLGIAGIGLRAWLAADTGFPRAWAEEDIGAIGLSADRRTVHVRSVEYRSDSCYEARAEVDQGAERWTVTLEVRRDQEWCTLEGCIGGQPAGAVVARSLAPGETFDCPTAVVELQEPVPDGVEVVPA
jgi:hypothetical protein